MTPIKENLAFLIRGGRGTLDYGIMVMHRPPGKDVVHTYVSCKREGRKVVPCENRCREMFIVTYVCLYVDGMA